MRLAFLADIHGNLPAFEAALKHAAAQSPDRIILLGDVINCAPDSAACWQLARSLNCTMLRGNHERYAAHLGTPQADPIWNSEQFAPLHWTAAQFSQEERRAMLDLPNMLNLPELPDLLLVHASARGDHDSLAAYTPDDEVQAMFAGVTHPWIIRGHNHLGQVRLWEHGVIVTTGSVGLPLDAQPTAQYLLLDREKDGWRIRHQSAPYCIETTTRRFEDSGYLKAAGPMARLYLREIQTASPHIVPFLRAYRDWREHGLCLGAAVERFLAA